MRSYTLSIKGEDFPSYADPLKVKTNSFDEAMKVVDLMLKNGHTVSVLCEEVEDVPPSDEFIDAVAKKVAARISEGTPPYEFAMDEHEAEQVEALAG